MQVSCKVSYSVLVYVERHGAQLDSFFENFETPLELLRDPSCWLAVDKMEEFLAGLTDFLDQKNASQYIREIGQTNFELRAWGVLDSVLKMVESPKDIFSQPERFLSYFLTPHPELTIRKLEDHKVEFALAKKPLAPLVLAYLIGAVEGLPNYMGKPTAIIEAINDETYQISWFDDQQSLFDEQEKRRRQFHPEIVHSVMQSLQEQQKGSSDQKPEISEGDKHIASEAFERMVAIEVEKRMDEWDAKHRDFDDSLFKIKNDFYKMYDYFTRAQQIITLISPTARKASVREAMRRVDWEYVQKEFPNMVESACDAILSIKGAMHREDKPLAVVAPLRQPVDLNELIDGVVEKLSLGERSLKIDKHWLLDRNVSVHPESFALALEQVFNNSVSRSSKDGELKIVTRPAGSKVQIEISDTSSGYSSEKLESLFDSANEINLTSSQEIIQQHHGQISVSSRQGVGSIYLIEIPV